MTHCYVKGEKFKCPKCGEKLRVNYQIELSDEVGGGSPMYRITEDMVSTCIWFDGIVLDTSSSKKEY